MKIGKYRVHYNLKSFMIAFLVVMNTQILLLEGYGVSWLKVLFLCLGCLFNLLLIKGSFSAPYEQVGVDKSLVRSDYQNPV